MEPNKRQTLTQEELVADLCALGYTSASVTSIAAWRKVDLLPQFSSGSRGQGRGAGRDKSLWSSPTSRTQSGRGTHGSAQELPAS